LEKDYLWLNISVLPYFRALMRSIEARFYHDLDLPAPTLDVGCGDGHFASVAFNRRLETGIDPWGPPIHEAIHWNAYQSLVQGDAGLMPFPDRTFKSAVSNSVLEHIPHLDTVLVETARVLEPGAPFIFCVPNHRFLENLSISNGLDRMGLKSLGNSYRSFFNRISRHYHIDSPEVWYPRLEKAGFQVIKWWHYYPPEALHVSEWGHYLGAPTLITRKLTGRWILFPSHSNPFMALIDRSLRPYYDRNPVCENGVCTFYITSRQG
jgi:SAM-dependent methyltransferase